MKAALILLAVTVLSGCAAVVAALPSKAAMAAAASSAYATAAPYATATNAGAMAAVGGFGGLAVTTHGSAGKLVGMSEANLYVCTGPIDRKRETVAPGLEKWTYEKSACRVTLTLEKGFVTEVDFGSPSLACDAVMGRCI
jgi:uncharacterized protein YceK